jgi:type IV secretory pathway VirB2 component (pilin)
MNGMALIGMHGAMATGMSITGIIATGITGMQGIPEWSAQNRQGSV